MRGKFHSKKGIISKKRRGHISTPTIQFFYKFKNANSLIKRFLELRKWPTKAKYIKMKKKNIVAFARIWFISFISLFYARLSGKVHTKFASFYKQKPTLFVHSKLYWFFTYHKFEIYLTPSWHPTLASVPPIQPVCFAKHSHKKKKQAAVCKARTI